jgi:hypothetical protein
MGCRFLLATFFRSAVFFMGVLRRTRPKTRRFHAELVPQATVRGSFRYGSSGGWMRPGVARNYFHEWAVRAMIFDILERENIPAPVASEALRGWNGESHVWQRA